MAVVKSFKQSLACFVLEDKYKGLKEIDAGQSCVATARRYGAT